MAMHRQTIKPPGMVLESGILDVTGDQWRKVNPVHWLSFILLIGISNLVARARPMRGLAWSFF
jgi:hypothetical protein